MALVIVTGGRDYADARKVAKVLGALNIGILIQGGARGADRLAKEWAESKKIQVIEVEAEWSKHGKKAGPMRNAEMLRRYPDALVVAFPGGAGTADCTRQAVVLGMTVLKVE